MLQNLKIDIIYYETPSDFEFEFNLGGCCHCRVLNNSTSSPKELIGCLSKAVGRSRIIIVVGNLNTPNGLYSLISKAIGRQLDTVDADEYGIIAQSNTTIIKGGLPLVSSDGLLSGCIVESGPQSIILLPEEKNLRKDITENLVFQYVSAVSRTPDTDSVIFPDSNIQESTSQNQEIINEPETELLESEEPTDDNIQTESEIQIESNIELPPSITEMITEDIQTNTTAENDKYNEIATQNDNENFFDIFAEQNNNDNNDNNDFIYSDDEVAQNNTKDYETKDTSKNQGINIIIWLIIGLMFIIIGVLAYMLIYVPLKNGVDITEYVRQIFNQ